MSYARCAVGISGDGREASLVATAVDIAGRLGTESLLFLHVVQPVLLTNFLTDIPLGPDVPIILDRDPLADEQALRDYIAGQTTVPEELSAGYRILTGEVGEELRAEAATLDLMILGHHHMSGLAHLFRHSTDERVLNNVRCQVLVVPE